MASLSKAVSCGSCKDGVEMPFPFTMAFQPIVDVESRTVFAYEALVRGMEGQGAAWVLEQVTAENRYRFDQSCRVTAIKMAAELGLAETGASLSINFIPGAVYSPAACIQLTLWTAHQVGFPLDRLIFEITEGEEVTDRGHLGRIVKEYQKHGFRLALDDFGAGYAGLNLLAELQSEVVKLDMALVRNVQERPTALAVVQSMAALCQTLGREMIAEGVETIEEYEALRDCGIRLFQGFLLAKPGFQELPRFVVPTVRNKPTDEEIRAMRAALGTARPTAEPTAVPPAFVIL